MRLLERVMDSLCWTCRYLNYCQLHMKGGRGEGTIVDKCPKYAIGYMTIGQAANWLGVSRTAFYYNRKYYEKRLVRMGICLYDGREERFGRAMRRSDYVNSRAEASIEAAEQLLKRLNNREV